MPMPCATCAHPARRAVDAALLAGVPLRTLSNRYGLSPIGLSRHRRNHLRAGTAPPVVPPASPAAAPSAAGEEVLPGITLVHAPAEAYLPTLAALAPGSVHAVVTSPPYLWKRRYGEVPDELGQEPTPERFVAHLVAILRPLKRVLRPDGVLLLVIGDTHFNVYGGGSRTMTSGNARNVRAMGRHTPPPHPVLQRKSLIRVPDKLADALEADGWLVRNRMLWHKPNPLPETVDDRTTTDYETIWHLTLGPRYYWNAAAIAAPAAWERWGDQTTPKARTNGAGRASGAWLRQRSLEEIRQDLARPTKNRRSVITLPGSTYKGQHGAVMPVALAELLVAASTPPGGLCVDPFAGSGTTAVACLRLGEGRRFVGCEMEAESVQEATVRLRAEALRMEAVRAAQRAAVPTPPLPTTAGGWQLVLADPPWKFRARSEKGLRRAPERHYPTMSLDAILALPVPAVASRDSILALWVTVPHQASGQAVMEAWGYRYVTAMVWVKTSKGGGYWRGMGLHLRGNAELVLIGRRGKGLKLAAGPGDSLLVAPLREHSRKPDESYRRLEALYGDVRRLELFAREHRPGWTVWGLETETFGAAPRPLPLPLAGGEAAG